MEFNLSYWYQPSLDPKVMILDSCFGVQCFWFIVCRPSEALRYAMTTIDQEGHVQDALNAYRPEDFCSRVAQEAL